MKNYCVVLVLVVMVLVVVNNSFSNNVEKIIVHNSNNLCNFYMNNMDMESPIIVLNGDSDIYLSIGSDYYENGVKVLDNCDGDITNKVMIKGNVVTDKVGVYQINYEVSDSNNNVNMVNRNIYVEEIKDDSGVIYLTFDDGPSKSITGNVLDILEDEGIKATFFVINHSDDLDYLIKRAFDDGHTIGLHSYTHDYSYIYKSINNYVSDLDKISNKIYNITGVRSNIIRFPGGSSNLVSKKYAKGIMSDLVKLVNDNGYIYYDWNIESGDSGGVKSSQELYNNVISNLSHDKINMVLLHDFENNYYMLEALPKIIKYGRDNGYVFKSISDNTKQIKHAVNN